MFRPNHVLATLTTLALVGASWGCANSSAHTTAWKRTDPTIQPTTTERRVPARITINFAGDINFEGPRAQRLASNPGAILGPITPTLSHADLTVANLESALTSRGTPEPKAFTFRTTPAALGILHDAGIDVVSIANNHGLDFGPDGVPDALAASKQMHVPVIGIGEDEAQAMTPYRTTIRGHSVAVIAATQVIDDNIIGEWTATPTHPGLASAKRVQSLLDRVRYWAARVDTLVVFLHWGIEQHTCPSAAQQTLAHQLVAAGADIVVGGHAHRVQGAGRMGGAIVDYGLGNFAFFAGSPAAATSGVLSVEVGGGKAPSYQWHPALINGSGSPIPLTGEPATTALTAWNTLRLCTGLAS